MLDNASKAFFHLLARSGSLKKIASRYGMRSPTSFARRFIAGETVEEAIDAARQVEAAGLLQTLDYLGESVRTLAEAEGATRDYLRVSDAIIKAGIGRNLSLKLTQLGLDVDRASAVDNLRHILERAQDFFVRLDMESSQYTETTLGIFETLWEQNYRNLGVVLQADLYRTEQDLERIVALGARIRLVKGAYREPASVAYPKKSDVDAAYARLMKRLLVDGTYPAIATHDEAMIGEALRYATEQHVSKERFEFQMLYGIRRDLQATLVAQGYRVRVYIPFGRQWFPYFMRRLGERPANVGFVLRGIADEARWRVVAITGASAGIGRAIAIRLARDGASLAICARRRDRLDGVAAEIIQAGGTSLPIVADVAHDQEMQAFVDQTVSRWGQLDVIVCNAGYGVYGAIDQIALEKMRAMMDVNYFGTLNAARAALPVFRRQQRGHLVIISSIVGKRGVPYMGAYAATKFAQVGLAECLRAELAGSGIPVTVVYPISTESEFQEVMARQSGYATRARGPRQPVERVADAVARALEHPVPEVYPYRVSKALAVANSIAPGLCDRIVKKWGRKPIA